MAVDIAIRDQIDHIAILRRTLKNAIAGRQRLWAIADTANDETYENEVKGWTLTGIDDTVDNMDIRTMIGDWFGLHNNYFTKIGTGWSAWLDAQGWRVPIEFYEIYQSVYSSTLDKRLVAPPGGIQLGSFVGGAYNDGSALDSTNTSGGIIEVSRDSAPATVDDVTLSVTVDGITVSVSFASTEDVGSVKILGATAPSAAINAGDTSISVVDESGFQADGYALIREGDTQECVGIASVGTGTLTLTAGTKNAYTTSAEVIPLYYDITDVALTAGDVANEFTFTSRDDRTLSLQ